MLENRCKYCFLKEIALIIQYHQGDFTFDNYKAIRQEILANKDYNSEYRILCDARNSIVKFSLHELEEAGNWTFEKMKSKGIIKRAFLTNTPDQVVRSFLYATNKKISNNYYETFSTLSAALNWLGVSSRYIDTVEYEIEKLKLDE